MFREAFVALTVLVAAASVGAASTVTVIEDDAGRPLGRLALPDAPGSATVLVVVAHGYGHTTASWHGHLQAFADAGAIAVAVEYGNWDADVGAARVVEQARALTAAYPAVEDVVLLGFSMGGSTAALALQQTTATKPDGSPLFDWFVAGEGVSMLHETYAEASAVAPAATFQPALRLAADTVREIEAECGSPVGPVCLAERSYALNADEIASRGLRGAWVIHDVNDGLVPYDQGVEGAAALRAAGLPVQFTTVLRGTSAQCGDEVGTSLTGHAGQKDVACLAGHSSEASSTQAVIRLTLDTVLAFVASGEGPVDGDFVSDEGAVGPVADP